MLTRRSIALYVCSAQVFQIGYSARSAGSTAIAFGISAASQLRMMYIAVLSASTVN
jgi:hypothetical protein